MKKIFGSALFVMLLLACFVGITYSYEYNEDELIFFELNGPHEIELELGNVYVEQGVKVLKNGVDVSDSVLIDDSSLDVNKVGDYKIKYQYINNGSVEYINRFVYVREYISPEIRLLGDETMYLKLNGTYVEPGYEVIDNYDTDLNNKVSTVSNFILDKVGEYTIKYIVVDSSGNEGIAIRKIIVQ